MRAVSRKTGVVVDGRMGVWSNGFASRHRWASRAKAGGASRSRWRLTNIGVSPAVEFERVKIDATVDLQPCYSVSIGRQYG